MLELKNISYVVEDKEILKDIQIYAAQDRHGNHSADLRSDHF